MDTYDWAETNQKQVSVVIFIFVCLYKYFNIILSCSPHLLNYLKNVYSCGLFIHWLSVYALFYYPPSLSALSVNCAASIFFWHVYSLYFILFFPLPRTYLFMRTYFTPSHLVVHSSIACPSHNGITSCMEPPFEKLSNTFSHLAGILKENTATVKSRK